MKTIIRNVLSVLRRYKIMGGGLYRRISGED